MFKGTMFCAVDMADPACTAVQRQTFHQPCVTEEQNCLDFCFWNQVQDDAF